MVKDGIADAVQAALKKLFDPVLTERIPDDMRRLVERLR
jgi:hypothetical protein